MKRVENFPDDENGDVLRRMQESGDDLSKARNIDFTVVLPTREASERFAAPFMAAGYQVKIDESGTVPELPWDVIVVKHMVPTHAAITEFEEELERYAAPLTGRNDGWGCFEQQNDLH